MVGSLVDGISVKLNAEFGDGFKIYADESIVQGFEEPCFFIQLLTASRTPYPSKRFQRLNSFDVHYFAARDYDYAELAAVGERLFSVLDLIETADGNAFRGTGMRNEIQDGVFHFYVNYNAFLFIAEKEEEMDGIELKQGLER